MAENDGGSTATLGSPSLADFLGDDFLPAVDESPESETDDAGSPPESDGSEASDPARSEGSPDAEHAGSPPAVAAEIAPDAEDPTDYLADATPLPFVVDGQERTFDGITYLGPDKGAIIPPDKLKDVQQALSERAHLHETKLRQSEEYKTLERLTTWKTADEQGNVQALTGPRALLSAHVSNARLLARNEVLSSLLEGTVNPADVFGQSEDGKLFWRQDWVDAMNGRLKDREEQATWRAQRHFESLNVAPPAAAAPEAPVEQIAMPTVELTAKSLNLTGLSDEDKAFFAEQLPRYVRPATPDERQQLGQTRVLDASFGALMKRTAALTASKAQAVTQAADLTKSNQAKLAAAALGRRPAAASRPTTQRSQPAVSSRQQAESDAWDLQENSLAAGMRASTGR